MQTRLVTAVAVALAIALASVGHAQTPSAKTFQPPDVTAWKAIGCRGVPVTSSVLPSRIGWRNLHGDSICGSTGSSRRTAGSWSTAKLS